MPDSALRSASPMARLGEGAPLPAPAPAAAAVAATAQAPWHRPPGPARRTRGVGCEVLLGGSWVRVPPRRFVGAVGIPQGPITAGSL